MAPRESPSTPSRTGSDSPGRQPVRLRSGAHPSVPLDRGDSLHGLVSSSGPHDRTEHVRVAAVVVAEREFVDVERQVLLRHVVERTHDSTLEQRPERVDRARVDLAANVLALGVVHRLVPVAVGHELLVAGVLVARDQLARRVDRPVDEPAQRLLVGALDHLSDDRALARDGTDDGHLAGRAAPALVLGQAATNAANARPALETLAGCVVVSVEDAAMLSSCVSEDMSGAPPEYRVSLRRFRAAIAEAEEAMR